MSEDLIHLSLSRADAELIADLADTGLDRETSFPSMDGFTPAYRAELDRLREDGQRVINLLDAALAAPAEGPGPTRKHLADIAEAIWNGTRWHTGKEGDFIEDATEILCGHFGVAEGPERAATGETGYYIGVDADGQKGRVANNVHFTDSRKRKRAAIGGGGEGEE